MANHEDYPSFHQITTTEKKTSPDASLSKCPVARKSCTTPIEEPSKLHQVSLSHVRRKIDFNADTDATPQNHVESLVSALAEIEKEQERNRVKWNFDFINEVPLEGDWVWERVAGESPRATDVVSSLQSGEENRRI